MIGIALLVTAPAAFKCAIDMNPRTAISGDGKTKVVVKFEGEIQIFNKGSRAALIASTWSKFGHHYHVIVNQDGSAFAVYDEYGGVEVFNSKGKQLSLLRPEKFLTASERKNTPGTWACHPEGTWFEKPAFTFHKDKLTFAVYNGRKIEVSLK
jgi:hypothetical protein